MSLSKNTRLWLHGLGAAFIGGGATSLATILVDAEKFNINSLAGLKHLGFVGLVAGFINAVGYLKQSPLPPTDDAPAVGNGQKLALILGLLLLVCAPLRAQDSTNLYMAGVSYNSGASPAVAGSALYAHSINSSGTYAFTMYDALPATYKPFTVTSNVGIGVAQKLLTIDGVSIFVPTSAGISYSGTNTGWSWSTGAGAPFRVKYSKNGGGWYVMPTVRVMKSSVSGGTGYQPILGLLVGWGD